MKLGAITIICATLQSAAIILAQESTRTTDSRQVIEVLKHLEAMGMEKPRSDSLEISRKLYEKITDYVDPIKSGEALAKLAIACRVLSTEQNVGDDPDCAIYDRAYWYCVKKASDMKGDEGKRSVEMILRYSSLSGGDLMKFKDITTLNKNKL